MFNFFKKERKQNDDFLPHNLKIGSYLEFDPILFSNLGLDSKFIFSGYRNIVEEIGIFEANGAKLVNVYLNSETGEKAYIQLMFSGKEVESCILFKNYDNIFPASEADWFTWLGDVSEVGLIGDQTFVIEDTPEERLQDILFKVIRKEVPSFNSFEDAEVSLQEKIFATDLLHRVAAGQGIDYLEVLKIVQEGFQGEKWIDKVEEGLNNTEFYLDLCEAEDHMISEYENYYEVGNGMKFEETVYQSKDGDPEKVLKKIHALYSRRVSEEFFEFEFISLNSIKGHDSAYISIDIGIELPRFVLGKL